MQRARTIASWALAVGLFVSSCSTSAPAPTRLTLRDELRSATSEHALWNRSVIVSTLAGLPDLAPATTRLRQTPSRVGDVLRAHYDVARADAIQALLARRIDDTTRWLAASRAGDAEATARAAADCRAGSDALARALVDLGLGLSVDDLRLRFDAALDETLADATALDAGDRASDVALDDAIVLHALELADIVAGAIQAQHPEHFEASALDARDEQIHVEMRALWQAHVRWVRSYLVTVVAGLPGASVDLARLARAQDELGDALRPYVGEAEADAITALLQARVVALADLVGAAMSGEAPRITAASTAWFAAGDAIAARLALEFPAASAARLMQLTHDASNVTAAATYSRVAGDWRSEILAYDEMVAQSEGMADEISEAIHVRAPD